MCPQADGGLSTAIFIYISTDYTDGHGLMSASGLVLGERDCVADEHLLNIGNERTNVH